MPGLYFHIPYCRQACHYCDFHFSTSLQTMESMVEAMDREMQIRLREFVEKPVLKTLYFGGGTPSILPQALLSRLFKSIESRFDLGSCEEISFEVNPDDCSKENLRFWKSVGINRLSIGLQSSHNNRLSWMNRIHSAELGIRAVKTAQDLGLDNISLDLMYNFPESTLTELNEDIRAILSLEPRHISAYGLTLEPKTVFGTQMKKGLLHPLTEELASEQFLCVIQALQQAGFEHYEISNFARPGYYSRHNSNYWFQVPYLGIGPGAHGFDGKARYFNLPNNPGYIKSLLQEGKLAENREILTAENRANEMIMTRLRTSWGLNLAELLDKTGYDLIRSKAELLKAWQKQGLITNENGLIKLMPEGKLVADHLAMELMVSE
jgi:oxygen-independent coproporphyrinogen-3 oxidase